MPAGVSWGQYLFFSATAMVTMFVGSQIVHQYYRPLKDLNEYIDKELKNLPPDVQLKIRTELKEEGVLQDERN